MHDPAILELIAELSIAVLGFSGIVVVLDRPTHKEWSELEQIRFRGMIGAASRVLVLSLLPFPLISTEMSDAQVWMWASGVGGVFALLSSLSDLRRTRSARLWSNPEVSKLIMAVAVSSAYAAPVLLFLNATGRIFDNGFTPYLVAVLALFGSALMSFLRLLGDLYESRRPDA